MFPDLLWSYVRDIWDDLERLKHTRVSCRAPRVITAADTAEDVERPKGKPRPPAGGLYIVPISKPGLVLIPVA